MVILLPSFIQTIIQDVWLAIYGFKQRMLPLGVGYAAFTVCSATPTRLRSLCLLVTVLMVMSSAFAVWETLLPIGFFRQTCG